MTMETLMQHRDIWFARWRAKEIWLDHVRQSLLSCCGTWAFGKTHFGKASCLLFWDVPYMVTESIVDHFCIVRGLLIMVCRLTYTESRRCMAQDLSRAQYPSDSRHIRGPGLSFSDNRV